MTDISSVEAINSVLQAESRSRELIEQCSRKAALIVEEGRARARQIGMRADERVSRIHAIADRGIDLKLADIHAEMASLSETMVFDEEERIRLQAAVDALLTEMVGAA